MALFEAPGLGSMTELLKSHPCRSLQIETLTTLLHPDAVLARNIVIYGPESSGKTSITSGVLSTLESPSDNSDEWTVRSAFVNCVQCITSRHLFERTLKLVKDAAQDEVIKTPNCENLAQFMIELSQVLLPWHVGTEEEDVRRRRHFVLVFDGIDLQREAAGTLVAGLARLSEIFPFVTCIFIVNVPSPGFLRTTSVFHVHFPNYAKHEFVKILALDPPSPLPGYDPKVTYDLWTRFCGTVHDSLAKAATRTLPLLRDNCRCLWPLFIAPITAGSLEPHEFSKLLIASRVYFQDESLINPSLTGAQNFATITANSDSDSDSDASTPPSSPEPVITNIRPSKPPAKKDLASLLPTIPRLLLLSAYLASHNPARHDLTVFSTFHHGKKKKRGGLSSTLSQHRRRQKHRKIARKLLGAHSFVFERMMAIFATVKREWEAANQEGSVTVSTTAATGLDGDVGVAMATLASLRLLVRVGQGAADVMDRGARWRVTVGWDDVRDIGRSVGLEVEDWLVE